MCGVYVCLCPSPLGGEQCSEKWKALTLPISVLHALFFSAQWPPQGQSPYVQTNTTLISLRIKIWTEMKEIIIRNNQSVRRVRVQQGWQCVYVCVQSSALCLPFISICPFIPHPLISFPDILRQDNNKRDRRNERAW